MSVVIVVMTKAFMTWFSNDDFLKMKFKNKKNKRSPVYLSKMMISTQ